MAYEYSYRVIKENVVTGERTGRAKIIIRYKPLDQNGLYAHLGKGFPGFWRILELVNKQPVVD